MVRRIIWIQSIGPEPANAKGSKLPLNAAATVGSPEGLGREKGPLEWEDFKSKERGGDQMGGAIGLAVTPALFMCYGP